MRPHDGDPTAALDWFLQDFKAAALAVRVEERLFPEENASFARGSAEQMLRALRHKVPAQMAKAKQVGRMSS